MLTFCKFNIGPFLSAKIQPFRSQIAILFLALGAHKDDELCTLSAERKGDTGVGKNRAVM
jgi:hypothetical protein